VLWVGIKALFDRGTQYKHLAIYSGDDGLSKQSILDHVKVGTTMQTSFPKCVVTYYPPYY
jgi:hypothetical protein